MKLFKPNWISHDGQPIFSIDIHPDGSRFATGGQGDGGSSGKVIVWNMTPVQNVEHENNDEIPKVLCVMDNHLACVNSVRWSCNGRYLASGGDDRLIMIWQFAGYGGASMFGASSKLKTGTGERWRCTHTLKGHTGDVLDLAWSPGDQWLASCSIDNSIVVWSVKNFPEITTILKGHTSLVKGVTWDPIGSYLASQSDDKTVKIWKTLDWKLEMTITKPFVECTATTHVLRLSWSPDGGYLVSAHAMNNSGPTAQIIERAGWKTEMDFVGHRKAITCTRFNGCVFQKPKSKEADDTKSPAFLPYTCCAVGSRDRSLSVWLTSLRRPLVVIHDLFENSVMDLSWSFSGFSLLCCSWDGSIAYVEFTPDEIGQTLTQEEKNKLHKETYGKTSDIVSQPLIIENPAMLAIQEKKVDQNASTEVVKAPVTPIKYPTKQTETRTPTGRRRITPIFVAPQEELGGIPRPFGSTFGKTSANLLKPADKLKIDSNLKADISPVKENDELKVDLKKPSTDASTSLNKMNVTVETKKKSLPVVSVSANSAKDISKKTTPVKASDNSVQMKKKAVLDIRLCEQTKSQADAMKANDGKSVHFVDVTNVVEKEDPKPTTSNIVQTIETTSVISQSPRRPGRPPLHLKRKQMSEMTSPGRKKHKQIRKDHPRSLIRDEAATHSNVAVTGETQPTSTKQVHSMAPVHLLPTRKLTARISIQSSSTADLTVNADNELTSDEKIIDCSLHKLICLCNKQEQWITVMSSPIIALHVSEMIIATGCHDHTLHVMSVFSGRRLFPPICFASSTTPLSYLYCRGHNVMAIDAGCNLSVWDTKNSKVIISNQSFAHLITGNLSTQHRALNDTTSPLRKFSMTESGLPLLTLSDNRSFTFNLDISSWVLVSSPSDSVEQFSENIAIATNDGGLLTKHEEEIMTSLRKKMSSGTGAHASRSFHATSSTQRNATLALLEHKVAACVMLQSACEYRKWLLAYVRYLVQENLEVRLREVCNDLIGPPTQRHFRRTNQTGSWTSHVLGIRKRILLQDEVLPIIGSNLSFQRLYTEYQDQLDTAQHNFNISSIGS
ncbi:protein HIRA-like [Clavelina lepadiformis]|uniref:Protein HIRA n=1 Tax=Clavelina lepadiformis TaxID=159417 RepID=A0ABP0GF86_CLALP